MLSSRDIGEADVKTRTLLITAFLANTLLIFAGYYYLDTHVLAVSAKKFAETGLSPYEWCEPALCDPEYRWYAYPPLPFLIVAPFYKLPLNPLTERLVVKIPALLGMVVLTHALMKMGWDKRKVLVFIWLNPYFLYTSTLRGNFDTLSVGLMLESYLLLEGNRPARAGVLGTLSVLTKQYTAFVLLPLLLAQKPWKKILKYAASAAGAGLLIAGPFLLRSPEGFLNSTLFFHFGRYPLNYGILGLKLLGDAIYNAWNGLSGDTPIRAVQSGHSSSYLAIIVGAALTAPLIIYFLKVSIDALTGKLKAREALKSATVVFLGLSKVVNIQYFALLLTLEVGFLEWTFLSLSGMVNYLDIAKSIIPLDISPQVFWVPPVHYETTGTLLDGIAKFIAFILYLPVMRIILKHLKTMASWPSIHRDS